uniref:Fam-b protein n=1 Tax=Caenorhabditis tropicalis TaxID=1561998 RepID=A0A1I7UHV2_9PELO
MKLLTKVTILFGIIYFIWNISVNKCMQKETVTDSGDKLDEQFEDIFSEVEHLNDILKNEKKQIKTVLNETEHFINPVSFYRPK